jgi:hypothetical protein
VGDRATASGENGMTTPQRRHGDVTEATLGWRRGVACCVDVAAPPPGHEHVKRCFQLFGDINKRMNRVVHLRWRRRPVEIRLVTSAIGGDLASCYGGDPGACT